MRKKSWMLDYLMECKNKMNKYSDIYKSTDVRLNVEVDEGELYMPLKTHCKVCYEVPFKFIDLRGKVLVLNSKEFIVPDCNIWFDFISCFKPVIYFLDTKASMNVTLAVTDENIAYPIDIKVSTSLDLYCNAGDFRCPSIGNICRFINSEEFLPDVDATEFPENIRIEPREGKVEIGFMDGSKLYIDLGNSVEWSGGYVPKVKDLECIYKKLSKAITEDLINPLMYSKLEYNHLIGNMMLREY